MSILPTRITLTSLFGREFAAIESIEFFGACHRPLKTMRRLIVMTPHSGHVGYVSSKAGQKVAEDPHRWWVWNRMFQWCDGQV